MKLMYHIYGISLPCIENHAHYLCLEAPQAYAEVVQSLFDQCNGRDGGAILSDGVQPLPLEKYAEMIAEPFSLQFDTKKINTQLYKELSQITLDQCYSSYLEMQGKVKTFVEHVLLKVPYPVVYSEELDVKDLCKLLKLHIDYSYDTLAEKLCGYIELLSQLCGTQLVFLVDCDKYLTWAEQCALQEMANYHKIILIHIRSRLGELPEDAVYCILDQDYCILSSDDTSIV